MPRERATQFARMNCPPRSLQETDYFPAHFVQVHGRIGTFPKHAEAQPIPRGGHSEAGTNIVNACGDRTRLEETGSYEGSASATTQGTFSWTALQSGGGFAT